MVDRYGLNRWPLMVVYLDGLIIVNGLAAFWPTRVAQIELREREQGGHEQRPPVGGKIVKIQQKPPRETGHATRANGR